MAGGTDIMIYGMKFDPTPTNNVISLICPAYG